ncbi:hypothetical protein AYI69_g4137 [Smittium culicis]|uniref:Kinetochore protein Spc24 n=1 Tax=Smittium culicis TaxID=133412 RepID=A0A1R1YG65_9FUNG|nr:hypothetical protein AYI69_g4137 [Smittium culicis]
MDPQFLKDQINLLKDVSSNLLSDQDTLNLRDSMDILISTTDAKMQKASEINARIKALKVDIESLTSAKDQLEKEDTLPEFTDPSILKLQLFKSLGAEIVSIDDSNLKNKNLVINSTNAQKISTVSANEDEENAFEKTSKIWNLLS